ncbi:EAL domain-containing protein [Alteromonas sp. W364]|uniref:putative bifunctional diguanylate cyclase/phosphodiesterase n=1 Tax=Alteromonas sp. W364 TaxID=3075610 RepID=UPI0028863D30|nr:EAL domain-containing protein [Alteromonas sp. W364]MDT0629190.1 EAL domain-containing protein [Alteromonas sp. W364]
MASEKMNIKPSRSAFSAFFISARSSGVFSIVNFTSFIYIIVLGLTFKDLYSFMPDWVVVTQAIGVLVIVVNVFALKKTSNVPLAAAIMLFCMFAIHMANVTFAGGIDTVHYAWIFIFPILAGGTMGWRGQIFFWFISVLGTIYYYVWPEQMEVLPYEGDMAYTLVTRLMCLTIFSLIMLTYHFTLNEKMLSLRKALKLASFESDLFSGVFNSKAQSVLLIDEKGIIQRANQTTHITFGFKTGALIKQHIGALCLNGEHFFAPSNVDKPSREIQVQTQDHRIVWIEYSALSVLDENEQRHSLFTIEDISERKQYESELSHLAHYDHLTKMPNRLMIQEHLTALLKHHVDASFAVIFIDLDKFKDVNDMYGHEAGDAVLVEVGQRLEKSVREGDFIGRFGGDEFILLTEIDTSKDEIVSLVERVQKVILQPIYHQNKQHNIGSSVGIAQYPIDSKDANDLLRKADAAMYRTKTNQKGAFAFYNLDYDIDLQRKLRLNTELNFANDRHELSLVFQPIFDRNRKLTGAEALLRWNHGELGFISPEEFIPIAEDSGHILQIGDWVIDSACQTLRDWQDMGHTELSMSVNISYRQLAEHALVDATRRSLDKYGLTGDKLILELTERVFADDLTLVRENMRMLSEMGVRTAIDDFGIAYSSLSYLRSVNFDILKIDRSFVKDIVQDQEAKNLCLAIHSMAKSLSLQVTAEGIETEAHLKTLIDMNVDKFQGYYLAKPLTKADFHELLVSPQA